jgi:hypothetical protein
LLIATFHLTNTGVSINESWCTGGERGGSVVYLNRVPPLPPPLQLEREREVSLTNALANWWTFPPWGRVTERVGDSYVCVFTVEVMGNYETKTAGD